MNQVTNSEFINDIIGYSELIFEYIKQILSLAKKSTDKLLFLRTLESLLNDSLEQYIIEHIEGGILTILCELDDGSLSEQLERILKEYYESKIIAKQCLIPSIISQFYSMLSPKSQETYNDVFNSLVQQGVSLIKRKICQSLHECTFLSNESIMYHLDQLIKDPNEYDISISNIIL